MRFVCDSCRAQYMISDDKVGVKGVKVRCKKCGYVILVRRAAANAAEASSSADSPGASASSPLPFDSEEGAGSDGAPDSASARDSSGGEAPSAPAAGTAQSALSGIQDDEIGAVFDQVLKSGPHKIEEKPSINSLAPPPDDEDLSLGMDDDLASTRAVSTDALRKLVAEAEAQATGGSGPKNATSLPNDWFVAIDDAQQGPLTVDRVRDLWNQGEIGPDSLAWRAGMADWVPLSEITELASELAPKPSKPVVAASATSQVGTVVGAQGESSFALGGASRAARSESVGSPASSEPAADTGGWKPSAASALAALVSEEMSALSNKPRARSLLESGPSDRPNLSAPSAQSAARPVGMFDIPSAPHEILSSQSHGKQALSEGPAGVALTQSPNQPYTGPSVYGGASYSSYASPPPSGGMSGTLKAGIGIAAALVLLLGGAVVFLLARSPEAPVTPPAEVVEAAPAAPVTPPTVAPTQVAAASVPMPPPPAGMVEKSGEVAPEPLTQPAKPEPVAAAAPAKP
ncbi:MAG: zinc-ribbon domain-containing protein, partial [Myxococcota bacterium]|nr:zinc-ribbon domain-containing protein [Myxococcota bacterium]